MSNDSVQKRSSDTKAEKLPTKKARNDTTSSTTEQHETAPTTAHSSVAVDQQPRSSSVTNGENRDPKISAAENESRMPRMNGYHASETEEMNTASAEKENLVPKPKTPSGLLAREHETASTCATVDFVTCTTSKVTNVVTPQAQHTPVSAMTSDASCPPDITMKIKQPPSSSAKCSYVLPILVSTMLVFSNLLSLGLWVQSRLETELQVKELAIAAGAQIDELSSSSPAVTLGRILENLELEKSSALQKLAHKQDALETLAERERLTSVQNLELRNSLQEQQGKFDSILRDNEALRATQQHAAETHQQQLQQVQTNLAHTENEKNQNQAIASELEREIQAMRQTYDSEVQKWSASRSEMEMAIKSLSKEADALRSERDEWQYASRNAEFERDECRESAQVVVNEREEATRNFHEMERQLAHVQTQFDERNQENERLRNVIRSLEEETQRLETSCQS